MSRNYSIVEYYSKQEKNSCGYCRSPNTSYSHGMVAQSLTVQHYQSLIDRGWRRSGTYCYKPMMKRTCCPHYTIKCDALDFKLSKSQKKILKRMIKFLKNELPSDEVTRRIDCDDDIVRSMEIPEYTQYTDKETDPSKMQVTSVSEELDNRFAATVNEIESSTSTSTSKQSVESTKNLQSQTIKAKPKESTRMNVDSSMAPQKKARLLRIERKRNKLLAQGKSEEEISAIMNKRKQEQNAGKTLEDYFNEISNCSNKLELRLVRTSPVSESYTNTAKESFELYKKYQMTIHGDKRSEFKEESYARFLVRSPLLMRLVKVKSDEFLNTVDESANLFKTYQMAIHKEKLEDCDRRSFIDFLVKNPLQDWTPKDSLPHGYGSFHEQYWLNGTLIAVAVIDILPSCVSSVYFFYDPSYSHLSLGTFSSLREVFLTRQLNKIAPNLQYYYMGFYIHTCTKMRYKAKMRPSKLLCPETYVWCDIEKCLPKLENSKYSRLCEDLSVKDEDGEVDIDQVLILYHHKAMTYEIYKRLNKDEKWRIKLLEHEIKEYASLVGKYCAYNMLFYIN